MHQQPTDIHMMTYCLWWWAISVDLGGALLTLGQMDWEELSIITTDPLARLYVRGMAKAEKPWQRILQTDPNRTSAVKASDILYYSWLIRAVFRKYLLWLIIGALLLFGLNGLGTLFFQDKDISFALIGLAPILTTFGIYMAGLFGWFFMALISMFNSRQSISRSRMQSRQNCEPQSVCLCITNKNYRR